MVRLPTGRSGTPPEWPRSVYVLRQAARGSDGAASTVACMAIVGAVIVGRRCVALVVSLVHVAPSVAAVVPGPMARVWLVVVLSCVG